MFTQNTDGNQIKGKTHMRSFIFIFKMPYTVHTHSGISSSGIVMDGGGSGGEHSAKSPIDVKFRSTSGDGESHGSVWLPYSNVVVSAYVSPFIYSGCSFIFFSSTVFIPPPPLPICMIGTHCCVSEPWSHKINTFRARRQLEAVLNITLSSAHKCCIYHIMLFDSPE